MIRAPGFIARLFNALGRLLTRLTALALAVLVVLGLAHHFGFAELRWSERTPGYERTIPIDPAIDWDSVDLSVAASLREARSEAEAVARERLRQWSGTLVTRSEADFIDWYFDYWNQQALGLSGIRYWGEEKLFGAPSAEQRLQADLAEAFATRVLRPPLAQLEIEHITRAMVDQYNASLRTDLAAIRREYAIPVPNWERFLRDAAILTVSAQGSRSVGFETKAAIVGLATGGAWVTARGALAARSLQQAIQQRLASKLGTSLAGKASGTAGARLGGRFLGLAAAAGLVAWEVVDHRRTVNAEKPRLQAAVADYIAAMEEAVLYDPEFGMVTVLAGFEEQVIGSLGVLSGPPLARSFQRERGSP